MHVYSTEWKTEHYSDVAMIYSNCEGLESVDAPGLIRETARRIHQSGENENFIAMDPKVKNGEQNPNPNDISQNVLHPLRKL